MRRSVWMLFLVLLLVAASQITSAAGPWMSLFGRKQLQPSRDSDTIPQQVHVTLAGQNHVKVTWITEDSRPPNRVDYGTVSKNYTSSANGDSTSYFYMLYRSGMIHNAVLGPLKDNTVYYYRIAGTGPEFSVKTPPSLGRDVPVTFAIVGDLGQTKWSESTLKHIQESSHDVLLFPGDLSYADYYQPLWDSFGKLIQSVASSRPWMVTQGNHDVERIPLLAQGYKAYNSRWSMPYKESASDSNLYYSFEVAGVHVLMLGSYTDFDKNSAQYKWLQEDLKKLDRGKTPWLIAVLHAPWYNSNAKHRGDGDKMMDSLEPVLRQAKVDIIFAGHVHAYERTARVYKGEIDECGITHITIGDGGNREGLATRWNPKPKWSLFRQASFGHGELRIVNATHAHWSWHRNDDDESVMADEIYIQNLASQAGCSSTSVSAASGTLS